MTHARDTDETVRIVAQLRHPPPPPRGRTARRLLLAGGVGLLGAAGAAAFFWPYGAAPPQRLGPRRLAPPLVRATLRGEDLVYALARRSEQDADDPPGTPAPRDRIELLCLAAADLAPRFAAHLASVPRGGLPDAGLIAEQGGTLWLWLGGIGAVSAVDGQVLADTPGLAALNRALAAEITAAARPAFRLGDALVIEAGSPRRAWRFDPRDFGTSPANAPPPRPLPALNPAAAHGGGGNTAFRIAEARLDEAWFGLPGAEAKLVAPLAPRAQAGYLPVSALPMGAPQQLWRGRVALASAAPPGAAAQSQARWGMAERLLDLAPVPGVTGLVLAGFLTAGTPAPVELAGPPGLLVLHGEAGASLGLIRLDPEGRPRWRATLPFTRLRSVLPGARHLVLAGWRSAAEDAEEMLAAVALEDGAVTGRAFSA